MTLRAVGSRRSSKTDERGGQAVAAARCHRRVLPAARHAWVRRSDRARGIHAARSRGAPRLDHSGRIPPRARRLADAPGPARSAARDVAWIRAPGLRGGRRRGDPVRPPPFHHRQRRRRALCRLRRERRDPSALLRHRTGGDRDHPAQRPQASRSDREGRSPALGDLRGSRAAHVRGPKRGGGGVRHRGPGRCRALCAAALAAPAISRAGADRARDRGCGANRGPERPAPACRLLLQGRRLHVRVRPRDRSVPATRGRPGFGWLSEREFLDAVAIGMITPGPVVITAVFVGYLVAGLAGATIAALGVFLPPFLMVVLFAPWIIRHREHPAVRGFTKGATAAAAGAITGAATVIATQVLVDVGTIAIFGVALLALWRTRIPEPLLVGASAVVGLASFGLR